MNDIKALSKIMVKLIVITEKCNPKHKMKLARILKRAISVQAKLIVAIGAVFPFLDDKEINTKGYELVDWMQKRMADRTGRRIQKNV